VRLDKFLQLSRLVKRRTVAGALCDKGRVRVNGNSAKASSTVRVGDVITIAFGDSRLVAKVLSVPERAAPSREYAEILTRLDVHSLAER
jgi:ribosomal 50S subunit-recycling heat shock protein